MRVGGISLRKDGVLDNVGLAALRISNHPDPFLAPSQGEAAPQSGLTHFLYGSYGASQGKPSQMALQANSLEILQACPTSGPVCPSD
ncbi:hypothetical protein AZE42_06923 [Rhizopogon vesiculosus]|uniref:Uncharacterized protein n=1 Tax=Rhizopogon vesiculosus TaxID=180088 RepID=A0A1J8QCL5_9AGAM|nr:hypothetical protein AZE42_06923 [Rhizopogon vesiculosus]